MNKDYKVGNPFQGVIQSAEPEKAKKTGRVKSDDFRFSMRMPAQYKMYLQTVACMNRISINDYLNEIIAADMEKHPEYVEALEAMRTLFEPQE